MEVHTLSSLLLSCLPLHLKKALSSSFPTRALSLLLFFFSFFFFSSPISARLILSPSTPLPPSSSLQPSSSLRSSSLLSPSPPPASLLFPHLFSSSFFSALKRPSSRFSPAKENEEAEEEDRPLRSQFHSSKNLSLSSSFFSFPLLSLVFPSQAEAEDREDQEYCERGDRFSERGEEKSSLFLVDHNRKERRERRTPHISFHPVATVVSSHLFNWVAGGGRRKGPTLSTSLSSSSSSLSPSSSSYQDGNEENEEVEGEESDRKSNWRVVVKKTWNILTQQVYRQIREHRGEMETVLQGLVNLLFQCFRNFFGIYTLGVSILLLPLCSSLQHLQQLHRVPLNDPFLLK
ncbi:hypothetical protein CSUI_007320 [Cystoisospora suis]|uniref:Transmembrane protein n=1 Tax=Cystoisospora suis TaxID=483139 RepID=A0A2C6KQV0_9APIC|nr:hypothetical protein CSUI_007320 [Cystoisospora suis]